MRRAPLVLLLAIVACAIGASLRLQRLVPDGIFYCGDSGLKALMAQQFAAGELHADLRLQAEPWVQELWADGLYPFEPPFVYTIDTRRYMQYQLAFPLLSALPYRWFGFRGLYVIPLVSTWALWGACLIVCRRWGWGVPESSAALAALALASPLTFYSAVFWEHAPAVALAFIGVMPLLTPERPAGRARLFAHGLVYGIGLWLREELVAMLGSLVALAAVARATGWAAWFPPPRPAAWFAGAAAAAGALLLTNAVVYGHPLGAHAFAVLHYPEYSRLANTRLLWEYLPPLLVSTFPIALVACLAPLVPRRTATAAPVRCMSLVCVLTIVAIPILIPDVRLGGHGGKQWGPRFLLVVVPFLSLLAGQCIRDVRLERSRALRTGLALAFAAAFVPAVRMNLFGAHAVLAEDYHERVMPSLAYLRERQGMAIGMPYQFIAMELMPALGANRFFLTREDAQIARLVLALDARGQREFIYVGFFRYERQPLTTAAGRVVRFEPIGRYGEYYLGRVHW